MKRKKSTKSKKSLTIKNPSPMPNVKVRPDGTWDIRVGWTSETGVLREVKEVCHNHDPEYVRTRVNAIKIEIARIRGGLPKSAAPETLGEAIEKFKEIECVEAVYQNGQKIAGRKSLKAFGYQLGYIEAEFGYRQLHTISYADLKAYKLKRLKTNTRHGHPRSIATVNREMQTFRMLLFFCEREDWIPKSPFRAGKPLISLAEEQARFVSWSYEEEYKALEYIKTQSFKYLAVMIICVVDGGFRRGELLKMTWKQVNFEREEILLPAQDTKTNKSRTVYMTAAMKDALSAWKEVRGAKGKSGADMPVIGVLDSKKAWNRVRKHIVREDLRFADLRHVCASRRHIDLNQPIEVIREAMGHSSVLTTQRYINASPALLCESTKDLDTLRQKKIQEIIEKNPPA